MPSLESSRLKEILEGFPGNTVLVLGDLILDEYLIGDANRLSPEAPVPILHVKESYRTLGGAANTAANVAALGGKAVLIGALGNDEPANVVAAMAASAGIELHAVRDSRPTVKKTRIVGQRQQMIRIDHESADYLAAAAAEEAIGLFRRCVASAGAVVLSDYAKGFLSKEMSQALIREAKALGKPVIVDPRPQHGAFYAGCDYLTPNWKESQGLLGQPESAMTDEGVRRNGEALSKNLARQVLLTCGPKGIAYFNGGRHEFTIPTEAREVFDVSGAGDTVVAAFSLAKASGCPDREAVMVANRAAGVVVGKLGTATVTPDELLDGALPGGRLLSREDLAPLARALRKKGRKIVTLNGSFDLLHAGHLKIISEARKQGDVLIVGLNSDASVRGYKGPDRPLIPQAYRAEMLLALRDVDYVHVFDEAVPMPFLEKIAPDVHVNGSEYGADCVEAPTVTGLGGRVHIVEKVPGLSTSAIVEAIRRAGAG